MRCVQTAHLSSAAVHLRQRSAPPAAVDVAHTALHTPLVRTVPQSRIARLTTAGCCRWRTATIAATLNHDGLLIVGVYSSSCTPSAHATASLARLLAVAACGVRTARCRPYTRPSQAPTCSAQAVLRLLRPPARLPRRPAETHSIPHTLTWH